MVWWMMLLACAEETPCRSFDEIDVVDPQGMLSRSDERLVRSTISDFSRWTGLQGVCVDEVVIDDNVARAEGLGERYRPSEGVGGKYVPGERQIVLDPTLGATRYILRHELCHAYDDVRGSDGSGDGRFSESLYDEPGFENHSPLAETFAVQCGQVPSGWDEKFFDEQCGLSWLPARRAFMFDEVYTGYLAAQGDVMPAGGVALTVDWLDLGGDDYAPRGFGLRSAGDWLWTLREAPSGAVADLYHPPYDLVGRHVDDQGAPTIVVADLAPLGLDGDAIIVGRSGALIVDPSTRSRQARLVDETGDVTELTLPEGWHEVKPTYGVLTDDRVIWSVGAFDGADHRLVRVDLQTGEMRWFEPPLAVPQPDVDSSVEIVRIRELPTGNIWVRFVSRDVDYVGEFSVETDAWGSVRPLVLPDGASLRDLVEPDAQGAMVGTVAFEGITTSHDGASSGRSPTYPVVFAADGSWRVASDACPDEDYYLGGRDAWYPLTWGGSPWLVDRRVVKTDLGSREAWSLGHIWVGEPRGEFPGDGGAR